MFETNNYSDEQLAFVISCLFHDSINMTEFQDWCVKICGSENAPSFIYDLMTFDEALFKIFKTIGYTPHWEHTKNDEYALYGIAVLRGIQPYDMPITSAEALNELEASPKIKKLFTEVFDFINL